MKYLLKKEGGLFVKSFRELDEKGIKAVSGSIRLKILNELRKTPSYPNELAKKLGIHEQKIYYHINALKKAGLIRIVKSREIKGAVANYYSVNADAFGIELEGPYEPLNIRESNSSLKKFFKEFNKNGFFNGFIVVGSPLPHGPFKAVARDGHYAGQLGFLLGSLMNIDRFSMKLDTDLINENKLGENLILIGGPGTNLVTAKINEHLPVKFNEKNYWQSIRDYTDESCGIIAKIRNPFNEKSTIIVLAGLRVVGTKSASIALEKEETLKGYEEGEFTRIVRGYDMDGDGHIDSVEIIE